MIIFFLHPSKLKTHGGVPALEGAPKIELWSYDRAFSEKSFPRATYVFGDFDRLSPWDCELSARLYRALKKGGARVLNDGASVKQRFDMLRALHHHGLNSFQVWRGAQRVPETSFPVFLRTASMHRGVASDLLHDQTAVTEGVRALNRSGVPIHEIMIVQYAAEELAPNLYRKLAAFNIGGQIVPTVSVHENGWAAKSGTLGAAGAQVYDDEYALISSNPHQAVLSRAFEIARIHYGRADFGIVRGKVEIYEINTNPTVGMIVQHDFPRRLESFNLFLGRYVAALNAIDTPEGRRAIEISDPVLIRQHRNDGEGVRSRWSA